MRQFLIINIFLSLITISCFATTEVQCRYPSCTSAGWISKKPILEDQHGKPIQWEIKSAECVASDCLNVGYDIKSPSGVAKVRCDGNCETNGSSTEFTSNNGWSLIRQTKCISPGCSKGGSYSTTQAGDTVEILRRECLDGDCNKSGWITWHSTRYADGSTSPEKALNRATCLSGGCLTEGYVVP